MIEEKLAFGGDTTLVKATEHSIGVSEMDGHLEFSDIGGVERHLISTVFHENSFISPHLVLA